MTDEWFVETLHDGLTLGLRMDRLIHRSRTGHQDLAEFKLLEANSLDELCMASPAVADGKLFIRTVSNLYCLSKQTN